MSITYNELDRIFENVEKIPADHSYIPTVAEMEANHVKENVEKFLPYLVWVSEMLAGTKVQKEKETNRYINDAINACVG